MIDQQLETFGNTMRTLYTCSTDPIRQQPTEKNQCGDHEIFTRLQKCKLGVVDVQFLLQRRFHRTRDA